MRISSRNSIFILFTLFLLALMAGPIRALIGFALDFNNSAASQIVVVPFISAALIYVNRRRVFQRVEYSALPGGLVLMLGVGLFVSGETLGKHFDKSDQLTLLISSLIVLWLGSVLFFYGVSAFKAGLLPLLFLVFCIPIPKAVLDRTIAILQCGSADVAFVLLRLSGTPVHRGSRFVFTLPNLMIEVAPQCSGIRSGISLLIACLLAGHLVLRSWWRRSVLVLAAIPILIFKNALRISMLSLLAVHINKNILESKLHEEGGIPFFFLGLVLIYPVLAKLVESERKQIAAPKGYVSEGASYAKLPMS